MKKLLAVLLAATLLFTVAAFTSCTQKPADDIENDANVEGEANAETEAEKLDIG